MPKPIDEILDEPDDARLCSEVLGRIVDYHGNSLDVSELPEEERVVLLAWEVKGIIGNGGFRYLFEKNLNGDPDFALTAEAYEVIGARKAARAVRDTLALFPESRPPREINRRLKIYLAKLKAFPTPQDEQFWDAGEEIETRLAAYIRTHADAYRHLDEAPEQPVPEGPEERKEADPELARGAALHDLPH